MNSLNYVNFIFFIYIYEKMFIYINEKIYQKKIEENGEK